MSDVKRLVVTIEATLQTAVSKYVEARDARAQKALRDFSPGDEYLVLDEYGRTLDISSVTAERLGTTAQKLIGKPFRHRIALASRTDFLHAVRAAKVTGAFPTLRCRSRTLEGTELPMTLAMRRSDQLAHGWVFVLAIDLAPAPASP